VVTLGLRKANFQRSYLQSYCLEKSWQYLIGNQSKILQISFHAGPSDQTQKDVVVVVAEHYYKSNLVVGEFENKQQQCHSIDQNY